MILVWHYVYNTSQCDPHFFPTWLTAALGLTWTGVDLFFVLSGFLVGGLLLDHRTSPNLFRVFYARRMGRIFPLYYLWLGIFFIGVCFRRHLPWVFAGTLPLWSYPLYLQNWAMAKCNTFGGANWLAMTWSLAVEEQFYLVFPLFVRFVPQRLQVGILSLLVLGASLCRLILTTYVKGHASGVYVLLPCRMDSLLLGVLAAHLYRSPRLNQVLKANLWLLYSFSALFLLGALILLHSYHTILSPVMAEFGYTWMALLYTAVVLLALHDHRVKAFFRFKPLVSLGVISYGVYIFHFGLYGLVQGIIFKGRPPEIQTLKDLLVMVFSLFLTLALATLSYRLFELRFIRWGRTFQYQTPSDAGVQEKLTGLAA
jgi:peptidoglycan/LPS O-acetylase OafA/YrhL